MEEPKPPSDDVVETEMSPAEMEQEPPTPVNKVEATLLDHLCALSKTGSILHKRLTTIICTIGRVSRDVSTIERMIGAGMNVARLNIAHDTHEHHVEFILNIRKAVEYFNKKHVFSFPLAIALDTVGPEIRTGYLDGGATEMELKTGARIIVTTDKVFAQKSTAEYLYVDYHNIIKVVKLGDRILIDKGRLSLVIVFVGATYVNCTIETGGKLGSNLLVHLPGVPVDLPAVSERDIADIEFGLDHGIDMVCASFIRSAVAVQEVRAVMGEKGKNVMVIAKIENQQALTHLDEIIEEADGVMFVRGKLSIEMPPEKVFLAQTTVIARCNKAGKPVTVATQLLESTVSRLRPTRSEVTDIANAILSGADCVMLTGETATGQYPVESIVTMARICKESEAAIWHPQFFSELVSSVVPPLDAVHTVAIACVEASFLCSASAIIVATTDARASHLVSRYRPRCPIVSVTRDPKIARKNQIYRGIMSVHYKEATVESWLKDLECRVQFGLMLGHNREFIKLGDPVVIMHGWKEGTKYMNTMRVIHVEPREMNLFMNTPLPTNEQRAASLAVPGR